MLAEISDIHRPDALLRRRWFQDDYFDLIVWLNSNANMVAFQLCYGIHTNEHVVSWHVVRGYQHHRIDGGEETPQKNRTPVLVVDGVFSRDRIADAFRERSRQIDADVAHFVTEKLDAY